MAIKHVDPISRIEGHLGVRITETDGRVTQADVHGNLWRGFENFLIGRNPNDAITFTQRICGVCPVPHGTTAAFAVDNVYGYNDSFQTWMAGGQQLSSVDGVSTVPVPAGQGIPAKALHLRNIVLGSEFLMSHITHLYHLAAPSYIQGPNMPPWTPYFDNSYYHPLLLSNGEALPASSEGFSDNLWSAVIKQYVKALRIRRLTFEAGALFAGRMPMTSALVAGGVLNDKSESLASKCTKYRQLMQEVGTFIVTEFVPTFLALGALYPNYDNLHNAQTLHQAHPTLWAIAHAENTVAPSAVNTGYGAGCGNFLSWGAFPQADGTLGAARGYKIGSAASQPISKADVYAHLREHIKYSRYEGSVTSLNPDGTPVITAADVTDPATEARTIPKRNDDSKYSWMKAPRWKGEPMEVGPFARVVVAGLYPVDGTALAAQPGLSPIYTRYVKTVGSTTGLDPAMIGADLAVALVREGLATVDVNGVVYDKDAIAGAPEATLLSVYTNPDAVIMGAVRDWVILLKGGLSNMDRLRGRALEAMLTVRHLIGDFTKGATGGAPITWSASGGWIGALATATGDTYAPRSVPTGVVSGFGATEAPRGALMHFCTIEKGKISRYQCVVPTTWNAAPKDANSVRGPMEEAMMGIPYSSAGANLTTVAGTVTSTGGGVEALRVAQSFDPCIACAVH